MQVVVVGILVSCSWCRCSSNIVVEQNVHNQPFDWPLEIVTAAIINNRISLDLLVIDCFPQHRSMVSWVINFSVHSCCCYCCDCELLLLLLLLLLFAAIGDHQRSVDANTAVTAVLALRSSRSFWVMNPCPYPRMRFCALTLLFQSQQQPSNNNQATTTTTAAAVAVAQKVNQRFAFKTAKKKQQQQKQTTKKTTSKTKTTTTMTTTTTSTTTTTT